MSDLATTASNAKPPPPESSEIVGARMEGRTARTASRFCGFDVELHEHLAPRLERALQQGEDLLHGVTLLGVRRRRRIGDELGVRHQQRLDHPQPGGTQRASGLGHVDDGIRDVGHLGLGGAVGERDVRLDPVGLQGPAGQFGVLGADAQASRAVGDGGRQLGQRVRRRVGADGEHDAGGVRGRLGVGQLAEGDDLAPPLLDAVAPGDAEVEEAVGHVDRDLLGPQDPDLVDAGIGDGGAVGHVRRRGDGEVGVLEELHGGAFERALGQDEAEHGGRSSQTRRHGPAGTAPIGQAGPVPPPYDARNFLQLLGIDVPMRRRGPRPGGAPHRRPTPLIAGTGYLWAPVIITHGRRPVRVRGQPPLARGGT